MIETPQIVHTEDQPCAFIHLHIPRSAMRTLLPATLQELQAALKAQGLPIQPWFAHHLTLDDSDFDFEACFPVDSSFTPSGRIERGLWPAGTVARTLYHGDYPGLPAAWDQLHAWITQGGHIHAGDIYERYLVTSHQAPDPADFRTQLTWPLTALASESVIA